jgi:hypothetical protein
VEKSVLNVDCPENLGFKKWSLILKISRSKTTDTATQLSYTASNISAQNKRIIVRHLVPFTQSNDGIRTFHLENVDGSAKSWKEFGQWYSSEILTGTTILPEETKAKMSPVGDEKNPIMKAKLIYDYVQQKSRYVSIQVGIGGWKPMDA